MDIARTLSHKAATALATALIFLPCARAQQPPALILAEAVAQALERNPDLAVDEPARLAARAEYDAGRAGYLPRADFELQYSGGNNPVYVFGTLLTQRRFTESNFALRALNRPEPLDNVQTRLSAQQVIWDFGRTAERRLQAGLGVEMAERGSETHRRQVILAVIEAYYGVSLARQSLDAARAARESAEAISRQARVRVDSGLAVEADWLRAEAGLAAARQQEIQSRGRVEIAQAALNRLLGNPLDAPVGATAPLVPASLPVPPEDALIAGQRRMRTDYQSLLAEVRMAESQMRSRRQEFYPVLSGFATWETDHPSWVNAGGQNWLAGVSLRWNLFAGGGDSARLEASRHRLEQMRRRLAAMESGMQLEVRSRLIETRAAEQQVEVTAAAEKQSEESLRILRNRYDAGLATMTDLLSAEAARAAARTASAGAAYHHRLSYAWIEYAAGILSPTSTALKP